MCLARLCKRTKGFIYGERGVWRPGDNLYLSFILNDASNKIPLGHPIKFRLADPNGKVTYQTVQKSNEWNHYAFTVPTANDAPTGNGRQWLAWVVRVYKSIKIETIKPNRLKSKHFQTSYTFLQPIPIRATLKWLASWRCGKI
jgi:hypothetical protein